MRMRAIRKFFRQTSFKDDGFDPIHFRLLARSEFHKPVSVVIPSIGRFFNKAVALAVSEDNKVPILHRFPIKNHYFC